LTRGRIPHWVLGVGLTLLLVVCALNIDTIASLAANNYIWKLFIDSKGLIVLIPLDTFLLLNLIFRGLFRDCNSTKRYSHGHYDGPAKMITCPNCEASILDSKYSSCWNCGASISPYLMDEINRSKTNDV
jgi:hypothetical protein